MNIRERISAYTYDPLVNDLWTTLRRSGPLRSISVDITRRCNLRCKGCYFFTEGMDRAGESGNAGLDDLIRKETARGTNFVTVLGGEPSLAQDRVRKLAAHFQLVVVTNGLKPIDRKGLENATIAVSIWGDRELDMRLRGYERVDVVDRALGHYRDDPRVIWYMTLPPSPSNRTEDDIAACIENGNLVGFNYYSDLEGIGGALSHDSGFSDARRFIDRMLIKYPGHIVFGSYLNKVVATGEMKGSRWGYDVCGSISVDNPRNKQRLVNGNSFNPHFNAFGPDLVTPRRCCVGNDRDCANCRDVWAHMSWITLALEQHLDSAEDFFSWVSTVYIFYGVCGFIDRTDFRKNLAEINLRDAGLIGRLQ